MKDPLIFGRQGAPVHFLHANGYPPEAYRTFLSPLTTEYQVVASYLRPLWDEVEYRSFLDWTLFRNDLLDFFRQLGGRGVLSRARWVGDHQVIGLGHSIGATVSLMAALSRRDLFRALVLIEPVLFPPWKSYLIEKSAWLGLLSRFHPLIRRTRRRKTHFSSREAMFRNYRKKEVFQDIPDQVLRDYVEGLARDTASGGVSLAYDPRWEAQIYATGGIYDRQLWKLLPELDLPMLVIRGEHSDTLSRKGLERLVDRAQRMEGAEVPEAGHLAPLERPQAVSHLVREYLSRLKEE